ncbi:MAG: 6-bladed beta-propeller [Gammaproteobacteria bacterium]|nr:6-bladed beta-propeller [Gammaproteobacteria bacterium]
MRTDALALLPAAAVLLTACGPDADPPSGSAPETVTETIGDTTVVRTLSGSVWGTEATLVPEVAIGWLDGPEEYLFGSIRSIAVADDGTVFVLDLQAQHVRVFDSLGVYVETLGRRGEGPGEFSEAEAIAVLPDGRLAVRDPENQRVTVFGRGQGEVAEWGYTGSIQTLSPLYTDTRGRTWLLAGDLDRVDALVMEILLLGPDGTHLDTIPTPSSDHEVPVVRAEAPGLRMTYGVPFAPRFHWTVHPSGHFLTGLSSDYRIELAQDEGVLRIERSQDPVPASDAERAYQRDVTVGRIRWSLPDWEWDGPAIPEHKPFFRALLTGRDGRIWVQLSTEGRPVENAHHDLDDPGSFRVTWEEEIRYDVFEPDGTYLGVVVTPEGFSGFPAPVFSGDRVWAVTEDDQGVERVVRYRIQVGDGS